MFPSLPAAMAEPLTYICPFCDREVRVGQPCPGCAKSRKTRQKPAKKSPPRRKSWEQDSTYDGLDLPDEDFDYDDFVAREFGNSPHRRIGVKWYWWVLGVITLAAVAAAVVRGCL